MDGTIYLDNKLFDGVKEFLEYIRAIGGRYIFMTNNSSKSVSAYIEKLASLGIISTEADFVTSVDATIAFLDRRYGYENRGKKRIYAVGTKSFEDQMKQAGFNIRNNLEEEIDILLCAFDRELTYKKLEDACRLLINNEKIEYFATNPDWVCPTEFGSVPDCGSICKIIEIATSKKPHFIGKPEPDMALLSMEKTGFKPDETLVIGDRLYTDIACGINAKVDTCFVLSGEGTLKDLELSQFKPTYILENIEELFGRLKDET
jgi:HAD superfamily hydrolase (TIGR01450 family)